MADETKFVPPHLRIRRPPKESQFLETTSGSQAVTSTGNSKETSPMEISPQSGEDAGVKLDTGTADAAAGATEDQAATTSTAGAGAGAIANATPNAEAFRQLLLQQHDVVKRSDTLLTQSNRLVTYPDSEDDEEPLTMMPSGRARAAAGTQTTAEATRRQQLPPINTGVNAANESSASTRGGRGNRSGRGGRARGRGGRGGQGRGGNASADRKSRWPTSAEQKPDPHRWDIKWDSDADSRRSTTWSTADGGADLQDWAGGMAPAPVDWDSRPAVMKGMYSTEKIQEWLGHHNQVMNGRNTVIPRDEIEVPKTNLIELGGRPLGEVAPAYWVPKTSQAWEELLAPPPGFCSDGDAADIQPFWETYQNNNQDGNLLEPRIQPPVSGIDPAEETTDQKLVPNPWAKPNHV
ncbi:uncharacterized protein LTR77_008239 [Saxophila tyrrhenica]|uniref:Uncharacterized protein n=1 Tax=Saxophila tyrrhenica TaxID=1690608 RepID=A0AAV9P291_9PEZI|nr:hypothetical protein LTR77_008239 [Saxophila tyrrhenica]